MVSVEVSLSEEGLQALRRGDQGLRELMTSAYNEVLEAEMTEHLGTEPNERTNEREGYCNGPYTRSLVTRVGPVTLRVSQPRHGSFSTKIFLGYQRSENALVLALMEMMVNGVSTLKVKRITEELCGREFSSSTVSRLTKGLHEQEEVGNERPLNESLHPFVLVDDMDIKVRRQEVAIDQRSDRSRRQRGGVSGNPRPEDRQLGDRRGWAGDVSLAQGSGLGGSSWSSQTPTRG